MKKSAMISAQTMKAAQCKEYGDNEEIFSVEENVAGPNLHDNSDLDQADLYPIIKYATKKDRETHMIIKTLAVALAPGDARVASGKTRRVQGPPRFPYIPGGDCCGIVVESSDTYFSVGDVVAARFTVAPRDAMAEYARVSTNVCEKVDTTKISPVDAAALASASPAVAFSEWIRPNERVLILGAGGGIGSHLCQLARHRGASYVCGVSRNPQRLLREPLLCDDAIDYTNQSIYESTKYQNAQFDTIIDLACGGWPQLLESHRQGLTAIVKPASQGGRFITPTLDAPTFEARSFFQLLQLFMFQPIWRTLWSRIFTRRWLPVFHHASGLPNSRGIMTRTLKLANDGILKAAVDGPYDFTTEGVRKAFRTAASRHANGKVVVKIAKNNDER